MFGSIIANWQWAGGLMVPNPAMLSVTINLKPTQHCNYSKLSAQTLLQFPKSCQKAEISQQ